MTSLSSKHPQNQPLHPFLLLEKDNCIIAYCAIWVITCFCCISHLKRQFVSLRIQIAGGVQLTESSIRLLKSPSQPIFTLPRVLISSLVPSHHKKSRFFVAYRKTEFDSFRGLTSSRWPKTESTKCCRNVGRLSPLSSPLHLYWLIIHFILNLSECEVSN
jgi:hypothetical protein